MQYADSSHRSRLLCKGLHNALADICGRYLNIADALGFIRTKKLDKKRDELLLARDRLLHEWVPFYAAYLTSRTRRISAGQIDPMCTDTCNRYLHVVNDLGLIDEKRWRMRSDDLLAARNALLDAWVPFYADQLAGLIEDAAATLPEQ